MSEEKRGYPPLDILMRIRRHYGCTTAEAERIFRERSYEAVPPRGTGLNTGRVRR